MEEKKLKITFLLPGRGTAGSVRSTMRIGNELLSRGHDVRIFYRDNPPKLQNEIRKIYLKLRYGLNNDWLLMFKGSSFRYSMLNATDFSSDELIVSMCPQTTMDTWKLPEDVGIKVLYSRGLEIENWTAMVKSWKLPIPKIVLTTRLAETIRREVNGTVVGIAPNGVNTDEYFPCIPESERDGIGAAFRWRPAKSPETFIRTMQLLGKEMPEVPRYCYSDGRKPRGIKGVNFKRLPTVEQARRIYSSCKVWFHPSIAEGMPNPVFEAMACGCAVVSTDCGGADDIIEDGVNGFIVEVGNYGALVHRCMLLYKDDKLRKQMCENAMKTVKKFSWPKAVDKLEGYVISIYDNEHR